MKFPCTPCQWTLHHRKTQPAAVPYLHLSAELLFWQLGGVRKRKEGCVHLPVYLSARASSPAKISYGKEKEAGEPAEFWWILTRWELEGKEEKRRLRHYTPMRWLAALFTLQHQCKIWLGSSEDKQKQCLFSVTGCRPLMNDDGDVWRN